MTFKSIIGSGGLEPVGRLHSHAPSIRFVLFLFLFERSSLFTSGMEDTRVAASCNLAPAPVSESLTFSVGKEGLRLNDRC